ncbi:hypothetical protein, partial [Ferrimicrobium sp.]|uniref:hypothetical protein n=1 Tax=Ferrimicrobium sp. TaxID=2926050 RepID=UPI00260BAE4F
QQRLTAPILLHEARSGSHIRTLPEPWGTALVGTPALMTVMGAGSAVRFGAPHPVRYQAGDVIAW